MFNKAPKIDRTRWHHSVWKFTFSNWFYNELNPAELGNLVSICVYWQRLLWYGLFLAIGHVLWAIPKYVIYGVLYKHMVRHVCRWDSVSALLITAIILAIIFGLRGEYYSMTLICAGAIVAGLIAGIVLLAVGLYKVIEITIFPLIRFAWQVYRHFYFPVPKYRLADDDYDYNSHRNQTWVQIKFWLLIIAVLGIPRLIIYLTTGNGVGGNLPVWLVALILFSVLALTTFINIMYLRYLYKKELYEMRPELKPKKKNSFIKKKMEPFKTGTWEPFMAWLKAKKEKVCPFVEFVN